MKNHPEITVERTTGTRTGLRTALALSALAVVAGGAREALAKYGAAVEPAPCAAAPITEPTDPCTAVRTPCGSGTVTALAPAPGSFSGSESGRTKLVKPFDGGTFYPTASGTGRPMGPGQPNGFDVKAGEQISFYVTGEDGSGNRVTLDLYPWVPTDETKRQALGQIRAGVIVDGEAMETALQTLPAGVILESSKSTLQGGEEVALWSAPIRVTVQIPQGTHELALDGMASNFRAVLRGVTETHTPEVEAGIELPFEGDRRFPPEVKFAGRVAVAPSEATGYKLELITPNFLPASFVQKIIPLSNDPRVKLLFTQAGSSGAPTVIYESGLLEPGEDAMIRLKRISPPIESTDHTGPESIVVMIQTPAGNEPIVTSAPAEVTCTPIENGDRDWVSCESQNPADGSKGVYQAQIDGRPTNPGNLPRRHKVRRVR